MSKRLRVNPILCEAHGVCAELLPDLIGLDPWGYPILAPVRCRPAWNHSPAARSPPARRSHCCLSRPRPASAHGTR